MCRLSNDQVKETFFGSAREWICDDYSASVRFIAGTDGGNFEIWEASIVLSPLPLKENNRY